MEIRLNARLDVPRTIDASISGGGALEAALDTAIAIREMDYPEYSGSYSVTPHPHDAQTLATKERTLMQDVTVAVIPTHSAPNNYGTTFTIGD